MPPMSEPLQPNRAAAAVRHLRRDVVDMAAYTPGEQVNDCLKLNTNECPWPPSAAVLATLESITGDRLRLYPDPISRRLREAAAAAFGVDPAQVLAGNGSDDCLTILYRAFLGPGDRVACPWPTYGLYDTLAAIQGVEIAHVDYRLGKDDWTLPTALTRQGAKLVIVANPNNPSGTVVTTEVLRRMADAVDGILAVDEAYMDFAEADGAAESLLNHLDDHPNLVILRTFSKSYSLAGARLGLLFAAAPLVQHLMKVKDSYNVNVITQLLGLAALGDQATHLEQVRRTVSERQRLEGEFARLGWTWPRSGANFLLCEVGPEAERIYSALKENGILVRFWKRDPLTTKLRITVGRPEDNDRLLTHLRSLV